MDYDKFFREENISQTGEYCRDGAIDQELWDRATSKVLFVLKETAGYQENLDGRRAGWHIREEIERIGGWLDSWPQAKTYQKISLLSLYLQRAVENHRCLSPEDIRTIPKGRDEMLAAIKAVAIINISKHSNSGMQSYPPNIRSQAKKNQDVLRGQIADLRPDIIVAGSSLVWQCLSHNRWGVLRNLLDNRKVQKHNWSRFEEVIFYHANHPSAWTSDGFDPLRIHRQLFDAVAESAERGGE